MKTSFALAGLLMAFAVAAKIPPPQLDDAAKAKAAEAAAKTAWQAKTDAWLLCKAQDKVAAVYAKSSGKPVPAVAVASAPAAAKPASAASAAAPAASAAQASASSSAPTPAKSSAPPPCSDPGAFAYNAPSQTPLETSGAHSPAGTAASPPSVRQESATMNPAKK